ncbi:hypothetical protein WJX79_002097 [Trebouxia sp. C0005]
MYLKEDKDRIVQDFVTYEVNLKRKRETLSTISQRLKDDGLALRSFTSEAADLVAKANKIADNVRQATRVVHHIVELRQRETEDARNPQGGPVEEIDILDE